MFRLTILTVFPLRFFPLFFPLLPLPFLLLVIFLGWLVWLTAGGAGWGWCCRESQTRTSTENKYNLLLKLNYNLRVDMCVSKDDSVVMEVPNLLRLLHPQLSVSLFISVVTSSGPAPNTPKGWPSLVRKRRSSNENIALVNRQVMKRLAFHVTFNMVSKIIALPEPELNLFHHCLRESDCRVCGMDEHSPPTA